MDLNRVATFVHVVEKGSFTAAASALGLPKSSVSRSISRLEQDLGVTLLQRTTRKLALTDAGRAYFERARQAMAVIEEATVLAADAGKEPSGIVRLVAPVDFNGRVLADPIARFAGLHPRIHVEVSFTSRNVDLVEDGIDLALRTGRPADLSLIARTIGATPLGLFAAPSYLARRGAPASAAELAAHDCVLFRGVRGGAVWELAGPGGKESVEVRGPVSADEFAMVLDVALAGLGVALLPKVICASAVEQGRLVPVLPDHASQGPAVHLVYPASRHLPHRVALLRDFLVASFARLPCMEHGGLSRSAVEVRDGVAPAPASPPHSPPHPAPRHAPLPPAPSP